MMHTTPPPATPKFAPLHHPRTATHVVPPKPPAPKPAAESVHDYSSTQFNLPPAIAAAMKAFGEGIPKKKLDKDGLESDPHITLKYGNPSPDPEPIVAALKDQAPISVTFGKLSLFKGKDGGPDVLKVDIESPGLHALNGVVGAAVDHTGTTFPTYKPHATIGHLKSGEADEYDGQDIQGVTGETLPLATVVFSGKDGKMTDIPLTGSADAEPAEGEACDEAQEFWEKVYLATLRMDNGKSPEDIGLAADQAMSEWRQRFE